MTELTHPTSEAVAEEAMNLLAQARQMDPEAPTDPMQFMIGIDDLFAQSPHAEGLTPEQLAFEKALLLRFRDIIAGMDVLMEQLPEEKRSTPMARNLRVAYLTRNCMELFNEILPPE